MNVLLLKTYSQVALGDGLGKAIRKSSAVLDSVTERNQL